MVKVWTKYDPDPVVDVSTPEAAAEFKRKRDAGQFGYRNEAERLESQRLYALFEREYEEKMTYTEFLDKIESGEIAKPVSHFWKKEKQFWYDRNATDAESAALDIYGKVIRQIILLRHRDDGVMWYTMVITLKNDDLERVKLKIENALLAIKGFLDEETDVAPVTDAEFEEDSEHHRISMVGTWFDLEHLETVVSDGSR